MNPQLNSNDLKLLLPEFQDRVRKVIERCRTRGVILRPYCTVRGPLAQAKLWRQSRTTEEIQRTIKRYRQEGAEYLASLIEEAGPCYGRWATNHPPGMSWHQWQEAVDMFVVSETGKAIWTQQHPFYTVYAEEAKKLELTAGYYWERKDATQIQYRFQEVEQIHDLDKIDQEMQRRFPATDLMLV